jgi:hypothetical protein
VAEAADWASLAVTLVLGIAGFVVARKIDRDVKLKLAERRLAAYERLWALMRPASPYSKPLGDRGRELLHDKFTDWYYEHGDGMLLEPQSRDVYFEAKNNLVRELTKLTPDASRQRLEGVTADELEGERGKLSQRQLSLLRTQLKSDLAMFGRPYGEPLRGEDRAFLVYCGVDIGKKPWSEATTKAEGP